MISTRLADILRPTSFDEIVGQDHLFGKKGIIRRMTESGRITNMIFHGPPGTGKTTAAAVLAEISGMSFYRLNATSASLADVKNVLAEADGIFGGNGVLLYLDEIQYFNKKQQQSLLEYMESGKLTLIASTTENPYFSVYNSLISRSALFEFRPVCADDIAVALKRALKYLNESLKKDISADDGVLKYIGKKASGDVRKAINVLENAYYVADREITTELLNSFDLNVPNYDDDSHYDLLSALQKSIRGSDPDASIYFAAKLLSVGELDSLCRRLQVIASEDIGLAYPQASSVTYSCCMSARELGLPEAKIPIANAVIMLATAPKSNSAYKALRNAEKDAEEHPAAAVPSNLQSPLFKGYVYPHDFKNHYVKQQYLPDELKSHRYYFFGDNRLENASREYWEEVKREKGDREN